MNWRIDKNTKNTKKTNNSKSLFASTQNGLTTTLFTHSEKIENVKSEAQNNKIKWKEKKKLQEENVYLCK